MALFYRYTLNVALAGLAAIVVYKPAFLEDSQPFCGLLAEHLARAAYFR